ncbi:MAG TPA: sigma-70 family RNA polymerase sigma factor [Patescibacteria group bacterium]|nr:sigma-70 family RNA polymerase sigma factor [Patescibacteria group bacterium]
MLGRPDDAILVERYLREDDESALRELFERHMGPIHAFLARFTGSPQDADDLAQETFMRAWRHLRSFDPGRGFRTWLYGIARHAAIDFLRKRRNVPFSAFEDDEGGNALAENIEDDADLPDAILERKDAAEALSGAIALLSVSYREVIVLRHGSELSFQEMAEALGEPLNTVKSRYRRAFFALKKLLTGG